MRFAGVAFIVISAGSVGFQMAALLRKKCDLLNQILKALQLLRNEIAVCGTPLPQAFALLAASCNGALESLFGSTAREMDKNRWTTPHDAVSNALEPLREPLLGEIFLPLAKNLGKYDLDAQLQGIETAKLQAEQRLQEMEQERKIKSRTYQTLGVCTGLAVAILLI